MIIANREKEHLRRLPGRRFWIAVLALLFIAVIATIVLNQRSPSAAAKLVYCDFEKVKGKYFISNGEQFSKSELRSDEQSRSGRYSCKLPKAPTAQYGFGYKMPFFNAGRSYRVSVWRFKNTYLEGKLAVRVGGESEIYLETDQISSQENGWEELTLRFTLPFNKKIERVDFYVYTNGFTDVYFDDFKLEQIDIADPAVFQPQKISLHIKADDFKKIEKNREEALEKGILEAENSSWVDGTIRDPQGDIPVKVRLKGDWLDHLQGNKWSFRMQVEGPQGWNRLLTFSVHTPATRYYLHEWLFHQWLEKEDILTTRYDFVEFELNGQALGIYAVEEHFEKEVVEFRNRREGPIMKFSEEGFWSGIKNQLNEHGYVRYDLNHNAMDRYNADIQAFREKRVAASDVLSKEFEQAQILMTQYKYGLKPPAEIFDLERLAKYLAICDVLGAHHGAIWHNQRFYYNPVTSKLEPIGFDGFGEAPPSHPLLLGEGAMHPASFKQNDLLAGLFIDSTFTARYVRYLTQYADPAYLKAFFDQVQPGWSARQQWIQIEFPEYQASINDFGEYAAVIRSMLMPVDKQSVKARKNAGSNGIQQVAVSNTHGLPVHIVGYGSSEGVMAQVLSPGIILPGLPPRRLLARLRRDSMVRAFHTLRFMADEAGALQGPEEVTTISLPKSAKILFYKPLGLDTLCSANIVEWPLPGPATAAQQLFENVNLKTNNWYTVNDGVVLFRSGAVTIDKPVVIPPGYQVVFEAGASLNLVKGAFFLSKSPVQLIGSAESPIKIGSDDRSSQGFIVLEASAPSVFRYVNFNQLRNLDYKGWVLTGAVTMYESDVTFSHCSFRNNRSEDGLNTIRSHFLIEFCQFYNTSSDAFDSDFCTGEIRHSYFGHTVNDGVDFSGSVVSISKCRMESNGDKGISVGENSDVTVEQCEISRSNIAAASKDLSTLFIRSIQIRDCNQGFAAYQKKAEFGGSKIIIESYKADDIKRLYAISPGCSLQLADKLIKQ